MTMELPREVIQSLGATNRVAINNPGNDSFKVRHFWIELELADGRKCSSRVESTAYTQPANWLYGEGVGVKFGNPIESEILFDLAQ
jgi:hypothetical protein